MGKRIQDLKSKIQKKGISCQLLVLFCVLHSVFYILMKFESYSFASFHTLSRLNMVVFFPKKTLQLIANRTIVATRYPIAVPRKTPKRPYVSEMVMEYARTVHSPLGKFFNTVCALCAPKFRWIRASRGYTTMGKAENSPAHLTPMFCANPVMIRTMAVEKNSRKRTMEGV